MLPNISLTLSTSPSQGLSQSYCNLLQLRHSRQVIVWLSERCHQICCWGSPAAPASFWTNIFVISFNLFSSFSQLTWEALAAAAAAPALVETCGALAASLPPPPLLSLQSHRVAGKKLRWSARAHCAGLDNGPCVTTDQCGVYRRVLHHLPMMTLAKLSSGAGLGSSIISPGRFSR